MSLWLARPTRFAALTPGRARLALVALALLLLLCLTALLAPAPPAVSGDPGQRTDDQADVLLYDGIVEGVRHGGDYYQVAAAALRAGDYPLKPFVTFRLPTLALVQAALPRWASLALLYSLALAVGFAWFARLRPAFARPPPLAVAMVLLAGGMIAFVQAELVSFHEVWAGLLIALALALRRPERWVAAAGVGAIAMLVRETAALFVCAMALAALVERRRGEALGWSAGLALLAAVVAAHAQAVAGVVRPLDPASPGWSGLLGFGFFVETMTLSTALRLAPAWLAALLAGLALSGWAAWREPLAARALLTFALFALLIAVFGRVDTFYWGLMIAPAFLVGLAFAPDALRELVAAAARPVRRATVTRLT